MYAELELLGVAVAVLAYVWLRAPRRRHAYLLGILVLLGLLTHVSMFLVGAGLLALPGRRRDREAWRWRGAIAAGGAGWAALWGSSFLVQARGGHSDWIPPTTPGRVVDTISSLVTQDTAYVLVIVLAVAAGGVLLVGATGGWDACLVRVLRRPVDARRGGGLGGAGAPGPHPHDGGVGAHVRDRSGARPVARGARPRSGSPRSWWRRCSCCRRRSPRSRGAPAPTAPCAASKRWRAPATWSRCASAGKAPEVRWTLGVRGHQPWQPVTLTDVLPTVAGLRLGGAAPTGRVWILDWNSRVRDGTRVPTVCAGPPLRGEPDPLPAPGRRRLASHPFRMVPAWATAGRSSSRSRHASCAPAT